MVTWFNILKNCQIIFQTGSPFYNPTNNVWGIWILQRSHQRLSFYLLQHISSNSCGVRSPSFDLHLMTNDIEHLFMCLYSTCVFFIQKCLFRSLVHFNCSNYLWRIFLNTKNIYLPTYLIAFPWSSFFCVGPDFYLV